MMAAMPHRIPSSAASACASARPAAASAAARDRPASSARLAPAGAAAAAPAASRGKLADQVYERLKAELHDFALVPGDRFSEVEVGTRLGVSRTPVREALFRLRDEGWLGVESKSGWFVRPIDFDRLDELYDLRIILEHASVARLCARAEPCPELEALKAAWLVPAAGRLADGRAVGTLDEQFHTTLVRAAGNAEVARVHADVTARIRIVRRLDFTRADRIDATYAEHARILRAVMQRRTEQAQLLLRSHIEQSKAAVREITLHTLHALGAARGRGSAPAGTGTTR
jgi:DNA-binding GntR family transcriptional regulator